jgi:transposase
VRVVLTAGQAGDAPQAHRLLEGHAAAAVIADAAYDADHLREAVAAKRATAVIPSDPSRARRLPLDRHLYKERHLVECCIGELEHFRRVATRYEKAARNYLAVVTIAATILWPR